MQTTDTRETPEGLVLRTIRRLLLAILTIGMVGTAADLMLLDHHEDPWQLVPLVLMASGLVTTGVLASSGVRLAVVALQCMMVLFIAAGFAGIVLHYLGNQEFQREIDPQLSGWTLFMKIITAKAPPALAPAGMIQMGMLGLLYTYKHPALTYRRASDSPGLKQERSS